jgi:hypothetical protein
MCLAIIETSKLSFAVLLFWIQTTYNLDRLARRSFQQSCYSGGCGASAADLFQTFVAVPLFDLQGSIAEILLDGLVL